MEATQLKGNGLKSAFLKGKVDILKIRKGLTFLFYQKRQFQVPKILWNVYKVHKVRIFTNFERIKGDLLTL